MSGNKSKLDALGDALNVGDDTREVERPKTGRGLSSVLGDKLDVDPKSVRPEPVRPALKKAAKTTGRNEGGAGNDVPSEVAATPKATGPTKKSSASIPVSVVQRLREARQKRWDTARLVADGLSAPSAERVNLKGAEAFLVQADGEPRAVESFRLPVEHLESLDRLGEEWRMNRSQVLAALLDVQLAQVGF